MERCKVEILNKLGLHARPAMTFVERASEFTSTITVRRVDADDPVDGKSIMQMLMLAGTMGTKLEIQAEGDDEKDAITSLKELVQDRFLEEE